MEKLKENAIEDFYNMIKKSWTYARLTENEKEIYNKILHENCVKNSIKGTYYARWDILNAIYDTFLLAIGYNSNGQWREEEITPKF